MKGKDKKGKRKPYLWTGKMKPPPRNPKAKKGSKREKGYKTFRKKNALVGALGCRPCQEKWSDKNPKCESSKKLWCLKKDLWKVGKNNEALQKVYKRALKRL